VREQQRLRGFKNKASRRMFESIPYSSKGDSAREQVHVLSSWSLPFNRAVQNYEMKCTWNILFTHV
jgi:hypothetical protein